MAVEEDRLVRLARDVDEDERRTAFVPQNFKGHTWYAMGATPVGNEVGGLVHETVGLPIRIEHLRLVGNGDVGFPKWEECYCPRCRR